MPCHERIEIGDGFQLVCEDDGFKTILEKQHEIPQ
jgi:hypothetical protein